MNTQDQSELENLTKRQIRYICFRLQTEALGGAKAKTEKEGPMSLTDEVKSHFEDQEDFGGWERFAKTWDVDEASPLVAVRRTSSIYTNWNRALKKETQELPTKALKKSFLANKLRKIVQRKTHRGKKKSAQVEAEFELPVLE
jgi:hypothetical protein